MNSKENIELKSIAKHVAILNEETGVLQKDVRILKNDIGWIKKLLFAIAGIISVGLGKVIFFS